MSNEHENKGEQRLRFVAKRYREESLDTDRAWKRFADSRNIRPAVSFRRYWMAVASVILLCIGIGTWWVTDYDRPRWVAITTAPGQLKEVWLPDSTLVSMAGGSSLRYDARKYGEERRVVEMKGKAFFQVKRNEARPFSVYTERTEVIVLGTSFQVREQTPVTEVNVLTGKVCFAAGQEEKDRVILTAGMSASYSMEKKEMTILAEENLNNLSWKTKQLRFNDTPLSKVIEDLCNYYEVPVVNQAENPDIRLTATFNDLPLEEVLTVINQTLDVRLTPRTTH